MDMHSREQYLERVREEYRRATKKQKTGLLNEARKRTRLHRKVLIRKLAHLIRRPTVGRAGWPLLKLELHVQPRFLRDLQHEPFVYMAREAGLFGFHGIAAGREVGAE
jgi:hypothetical protein